MADITFGGVERIIKAGFAIKEAVQTARRNKKECRDIERSVTRIKDLLLFLNQMTAEALKHPAISGPLVDLAESMEEAFELIDDCEERHPVRRLLGAGAMARELRRVHDDILRKLTLGSFATIVLSVHVNITLAGIPHPPSMQLQRKIVIKIQMTSIKARSRASSLVRKLHGTSSVGISGYEKDNLEVVGQGIDVVFLVKYLNKKLGPAEILLVEDVKVKEAQPVVVNTEEARPLDKTANMNNPAPDASRGPRSQLFSAPSTSTAVGAASPPAYDELAAVETGCVLEDYVGMFDGPMPPAVIASLAGALFYVDDEGSTI